MNGTSPRCIVIGAGIVGASCAWHLQSRGAEVTVIDSVLPGQSTSFGNAGCISPSSIFPFSYPGAIREVPGWLLDPLGPMRIRWADAFGLAPWFWRFWRAGNARRVEQIASAQQTLMSSVTADYDAILRATGAESLRRSKGLIMLYGNEAELAKDGWHYDIRRKHGLAWQRLTTAELKVLEPAIQLGKEGIAVLDPAWQHVLSPADVASSIADAAFARGAKWVNDRVSRVESNPAGVRAETISGKRFEGDILVLATGVWTNELLVQLGQRVPLMAKRGYHSMLARPNVALSHPLMSISEYIVITPMRDGLRVAGTAEFARTDAEPDYRRARVLLQHAQRFLPGLGGEAVTEWMGQRPMMPDSMPVLGRLPGHQRVLCAFGHGHYGLTQGPTTGRIIADLAFDQAPHIDLAPFAADRF
jgi:D-amino-acid dehydrogenase